MSVNWGKVRNEYINGNISYRKLAEKHNISFNTLKDRAVAENWFEKKKEQHNKIQIKTQQKTLEKISDQESDLAANIYSAANELLKKLNIAIEQTDLFIEKTKTRVPKKMQDKKTGEVYTAWQEEEKLRLSQKSGINITSVKQIASALRDLQTIQLAGKEEQTVESPNINITISAATPIDETGDGDE